MEEVTCTYLTVPGVVRLELLASLVEETVLLAVAGRAADERRRFRRERDPIYELAEAETREAKFVEVHARWFNALGLGAALMDPVAAEPGLAGAIDRCVVLPARSARDEYADLHTGPDAPTLVLRLRPQTLAQPAGLLPLLRRELLHVADLLDPDFGFHPQRATRGGVQVDLLWARYRVLWDTSVDGRLARRHPLPAGREVCLRQAFWAAFPMLEERAELCFERLFSGPRPRHDELLALAAAPEGLLAT